MEERKRRCEMMTKLKELKTDMKGKIGEIEMNLKYEVEKEKVKITKNGMNGEMENG